MWNIKVLRDFATLLVNQLGTVTLRSALGNFSLIHAKLLSDISRNLIVALFACWLTDPVN